MLSRVLIELNRACRVSLLGFSVLIELNRACRVSPLGFFNVGYVTYLSWIKDFVYQLVGKAGNGFLVFTFSLCFATVDEFCFNFLLFNVFLSANGCELSIWISGCCCLAWVLWVQGLWAERSCKEWDLKAWCIHSQQRPLKVHQFLLANGTFIRLVLTKIASEEYQFLITMLLPTKSNFCKFCD